MKLFLWSVVALLLLCTLYVVLTVAPVFSVARGLLRQYIVTREGFIGTFVTGSRGLATKAPCSFFLYIRIAG